MSTTRQVPVRRPLSTKTKRYHVRLWEIPRGAGRQVKPEQIEGFYVEAVTQHDALALAKSELRDKRKRVIRSISPREDGSIQAVLMSNERRQRPGSPTHAIRQVSAAHMKRRAKKATKHEKPKRVRPVDEINAQRIKNQEAQAEAKAETAKRSGEKRVAPDRRAEDRRAEITEMRDHVVKRRAAKQAERDRQKAERAKAFADKKAG